MATPSTRASAEPLVLFIPGEAQSSPARDIARHHRDGLRSAVLELGGWDDPHRNTWVNKINLAIWRAKRPVVLVADGLACLAIIWWAEFEQPRLEGPVKRAILLSPPDLDRPGGDRRLARFGAVPGNPLPFPALLVANDDDGFALRATYRRLALEWNCGLIEHPEATFGPAFIRHLVKEPAARI